jgi:hypothetical protein
MFKKYFKTAIRSLWKDKATSFIYLFGLSVVMTALYLSVCGYKMK